MSVSHIRPPSPIEPDPEDVLWSVRVGEKIGRSAEEICTAHGIKSERQVFLEAIASLRIGKESGSVGGPDATMPGQTLSAVHGTVNGGRKKGRNLDDEAINKEVAKYLIDHPDARRDDIAAATGISAGKVSGSKPWQDTRAARKAARRMNRPSTGYDEC